MARGTPPSPGFQLTLPDSQQFSSPSDKLRSTGHSSKSSDTQQDDQHISRGQQQSNVQQGTLNVNAQQDNRHQPNDADENNVAGHNDGQQRQHGQKVNVLGNIRPANSQAMASGGSVHGRQGQQTQAQERFGNSGPSQRVISSELKQLLQVTAFDQKQVAQGAPSGQQHQFMMGTSCINTSEQVAYGPGNDNQESGHVTTGQVFTISSTSSGQNQLSLTMMAPSNGAQQQHVGSFNGQSSHVFNDQIMMGQTQLGDVQGQFAPATMYEANDYTMQAAAPITQHYDPFFSANNNMEQFLQTNPVNAMFNGQQQDIMMAGYPVQAHAPMSHSGDNNNLGFQQGYSMEPTASSEQPRVPPQMHSLLQGIQGQPLSLEMLNQISQVQHQQGVTLSMVPSRHNMHSATRLQHHRPTQQPTRGSGQAGNQNLDDFMGP
jgi:hypothetical protein